jgi:hypothetical protein
LDFTFLSITQRIFNKRLAIASFIFLVPTYFSSVSPISSQTLKSVLYFFKYKSASSRRSYAKTSGLNWIKNHSDVFAT